MKGVKKTPKVPGFMRTILAANLAALVDHHYASMSNLTAKQRELAKQAKVSHSTVQRIMSGDVGASLDNIELIATVFDLSAYQLLIPNLNAGNPQVVRGATKDEQRLYAGWRKTKLAERIT